MCVFSRQENWEINAVIFPVYNKASGREILTYQVFYLIFSSEGDDGKRKKVCKYLFKIDPTLIEKYKHKIYLT